jgi:hypothetical protein
MAMCESCAAVPAGGAEHDCLAATGQVYSELRSGFANLRSDTMAQSTNTTALNKPVKTFRLRGISASIFQNETYQAGQPVRFYKVSLQRAFRQNGEFRHNSSFARDEIPVAVHVLQQAWAFILEIENASSVEEA